MIHHAVHSARPEVNCVAHSHSIYGRTFCALGRPLDMITQDSCAFYNDLALYSSFRGIVLESDEGAAIAAALGKKKAALLQNHGLLTCGKTIEATLFWFMSLEKCCHSQLMADAAAGGRGGAVSIFAVFGELSLIVFRLSIFTMRMLLTLIKRAFNFLNLR
jgi:ribulose-5-phosphate 4-epimerase/fuculose-1-phosphate aldolase